jgi:hypothetical protein
MHITVCLNLSGSLGVINRVCARDHRAFITDVPSRSADRKPTSLPFARGLDDFAREE